MALPTDFAGPFDVKTDDLIQINADQAVDLFRQLLVIEAVKVGIPITAIDVPAAINVADGGIDAEVAIVSGAALPAGLIAEGLTRYQIKTGSFSASTPSDIRSLLVQPKFATGAHQRTKEELQPRVLSCFEKGGPSSLCFSARIWSARPTITAPPRSANSWRRLIPRSPRSRCESSGPINCARRSRCWHPVSRRA